MPESVITWHLVEGEAGCALARERGAIAVIVDALRASAMAAYLLDRGARELLVVRKVEEAREVHARYPGTLLAGERSGLPPEGFDLGNSPRQVDESVRGRTVVFTTTTGAGRLVACWGAGAVLMGTTVNASAVVHAAHALADIHGSHDVVLIPAGLWGDPEFLAQEDWTASAAIAMRALEHGGHVDKGAETLAMWRSRIADEGIETLFATAPHADKLRRAGLAADIVFCARMDTVDAVPVAVSREGAAVRCVRYTA